VVLLGSKKPTKAAAWQQLMLKDNHGEGTDVNGSNEGFPISLMEELIGMLTLFFVSWISVIDAFDDNVFPVVDALEECLTPMAPSRQIGYIFILGNDVTPESLILDQLPLYSANRFYFWRMGLARVRLIGSGLFKVDIKKGVWPRVTAVIEKIAASSWIS
jgi:hypothetical protein